MNQKLVNGLVFLFVACMSQIVLGQGLNTLNGQWHVVSGVMNGEDVPEDVLASMELEVKDSGKFTAESGGIKSKGKFSAGGAVDQLLVEISSGADRGRNLKAKWRMDNGALTIAFSQEEFPSGFDSTRSNKLLVLSYAPGPQPVVETASNGGGRGGGRGGGARGGDNRGPLGGQTSRGGGGGNRGPLGDAGSRGK